MINKRMMISLAGFIVLTSIAGVINVNCDLAFLTIKTAKAKILTDRTPMAKPLNLPIYEQAQKKLSLEHYRGQIVLVHFFAAWCGHCRNERPEIVKISQLPDLVVIGINVNSSRDELHDFLSQEQNPYTAIGLDDKGLTADVWNVNATPTSFVIDQQGRLVFRQDGQVTKNVIEQEVKKLVSTAL